MPVTLSTPIMDSPPPVPVCRFTVDEYHQLITTGILGEDDPYELLEGYIVPKMSRNPPHDLCLVLIHAAIDAILPLGWFLRGQSAVTTVDSEPEPDVAIIRGYPRDFSKRHPGPADMGLVVEVADSSLARDNSIKARLYARANVPIYWIVNIPDSVITIHSDPTGPTDLPEYRKSQDFGPDEFVTLRLQDIVIDNILVRELLP